MARKYPVTLFPAIVASFIVLILMVIVRCPGLCLPDSKLNIVTPRSHSQHQSGVLYALNHFTRCYCPDVWCPPGLLLETNLAVGFRHFRRAGKHREQPATRMGTVTVGWEWNDVSVYLHPEQARQPHGIPATLAWMTNVLQTSHMPSFFIQLVSTCIHSHIGFAQGILSRDSFDNHRRTQCHWTGNAQGRGNGHPDVDHQFPLCLHCLLRRHRSLQHPQEALLGPARTRALNFVRPSALDHSCRCNNSGSRGLLNFYHRVRAVEVPAKMADRGILLGL
jgi:hypothetical protein